jgi:hypothetical protein
VIVSVLAKNIAGQCHFSIWTNKVVFRFAKEQSSRRERRLWTLTHPCAIYLIAADRSETRIPCIVIEEIQPGRISIMGLNGQWSWREMIGLLAFLMSLK